MDSMKILDTRHTCQNCRFNDGMAYMSNPVKYKCTFDGEYYEGMHPCHLDLAPVVRWKEKRMTNPCEDCRQSCDIPCWKVDHGLLVEPPRWIPVTERLPESDKFVLVIVHGKPCGNITLRGAVEIAEYDPEGWILEMWPEWMDARVTHWMPIPEPPKEDE